ncbi:MULTISPECIES: Panacea domain-containing protein [Rhodopseudomonas]|uniref:Panacea domain-containing protein n=1 Tax=Rhodopseudomonas TaxID=1073 RepID=UPI000DF48850|nr:MULTISPECIES: type II toxin-antitoxin system antitoxin SocA domain-containing protein [Rhodopseudomonas]
MVQISTAPYDAREIANYLLDYADGKRLSLTQISLLKLIYFCHGWYLVYKQRPLIKNEFEAWQNGPVVKVVRDAFKHHGSSKISSRAKKFDLLSGEIYEVVPNLLEADQKFVEEIFDLYKGFGPWDLRDLTHDEGSPWEKLWNSDKVVARFGMRIRDEEILAHFSLKGIRNSV